MKITEHKALQALLTLLMMTAESMLSKRPGITVAYTRKPQVDSRLLAFRLYTFKMAQSLEYNKNSLRRKNKLTVNLKTGRFDNIDPSVIINIASIVPRLWHCVALTAFSFVLPCLHC